MRFSSLIFALPFVATAFAIPTANPAPVAVAKPAQAEIDSILARDSHLVARDAYATLSPEQKRAATTLSAALEELADGLIELVPDHPLNPIEDIADLINDITKVITNSLSNIGLSSVGTVIGTVEPVAVSVVAGVVEKLVTAFGQLFGKINIISLLNTVDLGPLKTAAEAFVKIVASFLSGLDALAPGAIALIDGFFQKLLGPFYTVIKGVIGHVADAVFGGIPGVHDLLKIVGLI